MVAAAPDHPHCAGDRPDRIGQLHGAGAFYLLVVLMIQKNYKPKETMLVITVGFLLLHLVFKQRVFLFLALGFGLTGILSAWLSEKTDWLWQQLSLALGRVSNTVLLTLIFFLVLTPVGILRRLFTKGSFLSWDKDKHSNFTDRDHRYTKKDLENTW